MKIRARMTTLLIVLGLALPALAMSLNEAMGALSGAKARGQLGEMPNGYLGVVSPGDQAEEIARLINRHDAPNTSALHGKTASNKAMWKPSPDRRLWRRPRKASTSN